MWFSVRLGPVRVGASSGGRVLGSVGVGPVRAAGSTRASSASDKDLEGLGRLLGRWADAVATGWGKPLWGHGFTGVIGTFFRVVFGILCVVWRVVNTILYLAVTLSVMFLAILPALIGLAFGLAILYGFGYAIWHMILG